MCGGLVGIASGARARELSRQAWWQRALAYNAGRISSYVAAGALTGALGAAGLSLRGTPHVQQILLALMSGALIVLGAYIGGFAPLVRTIESAGAVLWRRIEPHSRRFLPADSAPRAFGLGMVWGWLPCGMVYAVLAMALASSSIVHGGLVMLAFGLGTLPLMVAMGFAFGKLVTVLQGRIIRSLAGVTVILFGVYTLLAKDMSHDHHGMQDMSGHAHHGHEMPATGSPD